MVNRNSSRCQKDEDQASKTWDEEFEERLMQGEKSCESAVREGCCPQSEEDKDWTVRIEAEKRASSQN